MKLRLLAAIATIAFTAVAASAQPPRPHVLMISVDGMKPEYVTHADEHGLKLPNLRALMAEGTYADGVIGVLPTITHPSHTTLVTGVTPAEHGIYGNVHFDPLLKNRDEWYWFADDVKAPTLWQAAHAAGIRTASVFWPVTVNAPGIDYLIPAYPVRTRDDVGLLEALTRPDGYLEHLESGIGAQSLGPLYIQLPVTTWDERLTQATIALLRDAHPGLLTLHLVALDSIEHASGPFSPQANAAMEATDALIGKLIAAARADDPNAILVVVSDHGFAAVHTRVNLMIPFVDAGLLTLAPAKPGAARSVADWKATLWDDDGSAYVMLKDPADDATREQTAALLGKLADDPQYGIARILSHDDILREGGDPDAAFMIALRAGYAMGGALQGKVVVNGLSSGTHGYAPEVPEMRASFFAAGPGIAHCDAGIVDMRQVAPTVAGYLGVEMPSAKLPPILCSR